MKKYNTRHLGDDANNEFFRKLIQDYDEFIIESETDLDGIITYASKGFLNICGYTQEELIGQNHNIVRDPSMPALIYSKLWDKLNKNQTVKLELSNKTKDGTIYWVDSTIMPIFEHGIKIGYRALRIDITDKKKFEILGKKMEEYSMELSVSNEQLSAANDELVDHKINLELENHELMQSLNKFKTDMITIFTHELKTPLNAIINFSDYIYRNLQKTLTPKKIDKLTQLAQRIHENGLVELTMVKNILELSKLNSEKITVTFELMSLKHVINSVIERYSDAFEKELILNLEDLEYKIDIQKFSMIFDNIFSNALKYSTSKVIITLNSVNDGYYLSIEDDGSGIEEKDRKKIFNLFEQLDSNTLKRERSGTGVGLYTVKLLCEVTNTNIDVQTSTLGGAKFILTAQPKDNKNEW